MIDPTRFMTEVFAMWVERDREIRREAIRAHFHDDVHSFDHDGAFIGHAALETFSDGLQTRFPEARFSLANIRVLGDSLRADWFFGPAAKPRAVDGTDFVILDGDKIRRLYAFVNLPT